MLAGVTIVDPAGRLDRPRGHARGRRRRPPVHGAARLDDGRCRRRDRPPRGRDRRLDRPRRDRGPVLLPSPWHGSRGGSKGGDIRGDQEVTDRRAARRCRICRTSATPTIGEDTNIAAGNVTANFVARARPAEGKDHDRQERQDRSGQYVRAPVTVGDDALALRRERSSRTTSRRGRSRASRRGRRRRKDGSTSMERTPTMATTELARLPGLGAMTEHAQPQPGHWIERGPSEAPDGLRRGAHTRTSPSGSPTSSASSSAGSSSRRSRTTRPTAATTSRSAAPTSSSSRPAVRRWTRT